MNMKRLVVVFGVVSGLMSGIANADLLMYEGFDYSGVDINGKSGGSGWVSAWSDPDTDLNLSDDNSSLNAWAFPYTPVGARILDKNGGDATRILGTSVNMGQNGVTYFSLLMRKNTTSGWSSEYLEYSLIDSGSVKRFRFGIGSDDKFMVEAGSTGNTIDTNIIVSAGSTYFVVVKLARSASGNDKAFMKIYEPGDSVDVSEPGTWTVTDEGSVSSDLSTLLLQAGNNITAGGMMDELRIGETWGDVVSAEPVELLSYDGFDYIGTTISNKSGGSGWGGVWDDPGDDFNLSNDGVSLESSALLIPSVGSRIFDTNGGAAQRELSVAIDMNRDGVMYFGALLRKNTTSGGSSEYVVCNFMNSTSNKRLIFGIGSDDKFFVEAGDDGSVTSSSLAVAGETYYMVVKLVTSASGNDEAFLKVYEPGKIMSQLEPTEWTISDTGTTTLKLTLLYLQIGSNVTAGGAIDEFRIGRTWASVAPPPPQGTFIVIK